MKIKLTTLMKTKFNICNPHKLLKELKQIAKIETRSLRNVFEDTPSEKFDLNIVKKYILFVNSFSGKSGIAYQPEYWMYRCNISYNEAVQMVNELKKNKSTSKEAFIKRHGEEKGVELFEKFQKTSAYSTSDEWFKKKYGENWEQKKKDAMNRKSKRCINYWTHRGYTLEEATQKVSEYQKSTSGLHRDYYRKLEYSEDEIDIIFKNLNQKKNKNIRNTNFLKEKYPDNWKEVYLEVSENYRKRMEDLGLWVAKDIIDDFKKYRALVIKYTNQSLIFYEDLVENLDLRSREYHLDHKYSIKMGYINDIDPKVIGSVVNIEIVPAKVNASKKDKCSITKTYLLKTYQEFKENYENQKD